MEVNFYNIEDLAEKSGTSLKLLEEWVSGGIIPPEVQATDSTPIFSAETLKTIDKIKTLIDLGYNTEDIKKIIKKVGLPSESGTATAPLSGKDNYLTVGTLAEKTGLSPRTIKHWEEKGIIEPDLRSHGGFRLYKDYYIQFCNLIKDLQLFGYSLVEIKTISDYFRDFIEIKNNLEDLPPQEIEKKLDLIEEEIKHLFEKTEMLKSGIKRWEDLLKKQKKQIIQVKERNKKRLKQG